MRFCNKFVAWLLVVIFLLSGCGSVDSRPSEVGMPYGSEEYTSGEWTVEELVKHFTDLGFRDIKTDDEGTFNEDEVGILEVKVEIDPSQTWLTQYKNFQKGEQLKTARKIYIKGLSLIPVLSIDNNADFADLVKAGPDEAYDSFEKFLGEHEHEFIEFDGTITMWGKPTPSATGEYLHIAVEHGNVKLYKNGVDWDDLALTDSSSLDLGVNAKVHVFGLIKDGDIEIRALRIIEPGEATVEPTPPPVDNEKPAESNKQDYIVNLNTKKFHTSGCRHAKNIKESNRWEFYGTKDELIADGYSPCGVCTP